MSLGEGMKDVLAKRLDNDVATKLFALNYFSRTIFCVDKSCRLGHCQPLSFSLAPPLGFSLSAARLFVCVKCFRVVERSEVPILFCSRRPRGLFCL